MDTLDTVIQTAKELNTLKLNGRIDTDSYEIANTVIRCFEKCGLYVRYYNKFPSYMLLYLKDTNAFVDLIQLTPKKLATCIDNTIKNVVMNKLTVK